MKRILILLTLGLTANVFGTKRKSEKQLNRELKKAKLSNNQTESTDNLLNNIKDEKTVEIIKKYIVVDSFFRCWEDPRFDYIEQLEIYQAIENKNYKKAVELIDNNIDKEGYTPLTKAVIKNDIEAVKFFIKLGVNLDKQDQVIIETQGDYLTEDDDSSIEEDLKTKDITLTNLTALMHAIKLNHIEIAKLLIASSANLDTEDSFGNTALIWGVLVDNINMVKMLLNSDSNINLEAKTRLSTNSAISGDNILARNKIDTALQHAASLGQDDIVNEFIKAEANLNNKDSIDYKPIGWHSCLAIDLVPANADIFDVHEDKSAIDELSDFFPSSKTMLLLFFTEKLELQNLTVEQFKNIDTPKGLKNIITALANDEIDYYNELLADLKDKEKVEFKPLLSNRLASKFMQEGSLSDYHKNILLCLNDQEKIDVINYILDKNYKRINLNLNRLIKLKDLLLGEKYNFDVINKLNGINSQQNNKELITTYNNNIQSLQELIRKRAYVAAILSGPRRKTNIIPDLASNISSYLNLRDLKNIR